jgi:hypothetical protein
MAGPVIALPADVLRSSGLEVLGSGPGTIPLTDIVGAIPQVMAIAVTGTCLSTSTRYPSPRSRRPSSAAAAGVSSCGPDHRLPMLLMAAQVPSILASGERPAMRTSLTGGFAATSW